MSDDITHGDVEWVEKMRGEIANPHWSADHRQALRMALKWWYRANQIKVTEDLL